MIFKKWHVFVLLYLSMMGLSWFVQIFFPVADKPLAGVETVMITHDEFQVPVEYIHYQHEDDGTVIVIIPDINFGPESLIPFAAYINRELQKNVLIPFFPESTVRGDRISYSINSRAGYIQQVLDTLSIRKVDLIGHGYGGLVAIALASGHSENATLIQSLTLLSSLGVVELQFLGNHTFNRTIYSFLYPVSWLFKWGLPHMGYYHIQPIQQPYIRSILQMDQREVREQLKSINQPVLILHPLNDKQVSLSVAEENHRLLPQSYLMTHEASENTIYYDPEKWINHLQWFLEGVENNDVAIRENAHVLRIELSKDDFDAAEMRSIGGKTLLIMVLILALFTLVSEDIACISGGLIVASGVLPFWFAMFGCFVGIVIVNIGVYVLGREVGNPILYKKPIKWMIKPGDMEKIKNMFEMRGMEIIFVTRFIPGTRFPAYLAAGILKTNFLHFLAYFLVSLVVWIPLMIGVAALIGQPMLHYIEVYQDYAIWLLLIIAVLIYLIIRLFIPLTTVTGRRKLVVKWGRFREKYFGASFDSYP
ncbi:MAG: hypothetical protein EA359_08170 [Balneolaceae bacterium]|nr:MAG: hypothetical protein EA359_08170 [Balneolaceae bacterium]